MLSQVASRAQKLWHKRTTATDQQGWRSLRNLHRFCERSHDPAQRCLAILARFGRISHRTLFEKRNPRRIGLLSVRSRAVVSPWCLELLLSPHPIGPQRFGDRNDSPTWLLNAEPCSYAGTAPSEFFFVWQACSSRLIASCFPTITASRISIFGRRVVTDSLAIAPESRATLK